MTTTTNFRRSFGLVQVVLVQGGVEARTVESGFEGFGANHEGIAVSQADLAVRDVERPVPVPEIGGNRLVRGPLTSDDEFHQRQDIAGSLERFAGRFASTC